MRVSARSCDYSRQVLRRILWFVVGLLALAVVAAAIIPRDDTPEPTPTLSTPERTTVKVDIAASPQRPRTIPAQSGRFDIRMQDANKVVGVLDVKPAS